MGIVSTPLGFQKPDGNELVKNIDDIVSHNGQLSDDLLTNVRTRLDVVDPNGESLVVTDDVMTAITNDTTSDFSGVLNTRINGRIVAAARVVDPADYGVPVDGVADATASFQAMLDTLPAGAVVQLRYGQKFKITAQLNLTKPVTIRGRGAQFIANPTGVTFNPASDDVSLLGFEVKGPGAALGYEPAQRLIGNNTTSSARLNRLHLAGLKLTECQYTAVYLMWAQDFLIERCTIETFQYGGVILISPKRGLVARNTIRTAIMAEPLVNAYGIMASDSENTVASRAEDVTISKNYVEDIKAWEGIDTHGGKNIKILGNTVRSCRTPITVTGGNSTRVVAPNGFVVADNYVEKGAATSETAGIFVDGANATTLADGTIGHNTIRGFATDLILKDYDASKTSVAPQSTDATTIRSPHHTAYRQWVAATTVNVPSGSSGAANNIAFPAGMFSVPPIVMVTKQTGAGARFVAYATDITETGCKVGVYDASNGTTAQTIPLGFSVTQATPTSAGGTARP